MKKTITLNRYTVQYEDKEFYSQSEWVTSPPPNLPPQLKIIKVESKEVDIDVEESSEA